MAVGISAAEGQRKGVFFGGEDGTGSAAAARPHLPANRGPRLQLCGRRALQVAVTDGRKGFNSPQKPHASPWVEAAVLPDGTQKSRGGSKSPLGPLIFMVPMAEMLFFAFFFLLSLIFRCYDSQWPERPSWGHFSASFLPA